jgi:hypothetical protein
MIPTVAYALGGLYIWVTPEGVYGSQQKTVACMMATVQEEIHRLSSHQANHWLPKISSLLPHFPISFSALYGVGRPESVNREPKPACKIGAT